MTQHVAIIGAGWAGLAAAVALCRCGVRVTVFEASRNLGGRARRVSLDGQHLDNGQHVLIGAYHHTLAMLQEIGADPQHALQRTPLELRYANGFCLRAPRLPAPLHLAVALLTARQLKRHERVAAMRFMLALRARGYRIFPDVTVATLLQEYGQCAATCRYLWHPLCVSALNTPPERASAAVFATVLRDSLAGRRRDSDLLIPRVDLGALFAAPAARYIERCGGLIRLGVPVRRIEESRGLFHLDAHAEPYNQVIVATAPQHAGALLMDARLKGVKSIVESLDYQPIVTCYLQYPEDIALDCAMLGFAGQTVQWLFDRGRLGGPRGLLAAVISAEGAHREWGQAELVQRVHAEIAATVLRGSPLHPPLWSRVIAEKRATFSCDANLTRPPQITPIPGLLLAGDYVDCDYPGTLETAVRQGLAAAAAVAPGRLSDFETRGSCPSLR